MKCAVKNCNNTNNSKACEISFFLFPTDASIYKQWVSFCDREKGINPKTSYVCMLHFKDEDVENKLQYEMGFAKKRLLKPGTVPSIKHSPFKNKENKKMVNLRHNDGVISNAANVEIDNTPDLERRQKSLTATNKMNLNYDTLIKQELLNDEDLFTTLPSSNFNIPVKNEPISDDISPFVTIKNEPPLEDTFIKEGVTVKTENQLTAPGDSFIIYELETPPPSTHTLPTQIVNNNKQIITETPHLSPQLQALNTPQNNQLAINTTPAVKSHLPHITTSNKTAPAVTTSPPILLNSQLRKRHKVILPVNPIDKRTRYNIEGTTTTALAKQSVIADPMSSTKILNKCRSLNTGSKKIINHLIKHKRKQSKQEESDTIVSTTAGTAQLNDNGGLTTQQPLILQQKPTILDNSLQQELTEKSVPIIEEHLSPISLPQIAQTTATTTQTEVIENISTLETGNSLILPKETKHPPFIPELRVKCLCSLTANSSNASKDTSELRCFFQEMFEETRRLSKKQQRQVKMSLLQAVSDAEELLEQGKCCGF